MLHIFTHWLKNDVEMYQRYMIFSHFVTHLHHYFWNDPKAVTAVVFDLTRPCTYQNKMAYT